VSKQWHYILIVLSPIQSLLLDRGSEIMGFAELSIADIAAEYNLSVEKVYALCDNLGVKYKDHRTCLALEDAKAIINDILINQTRGEKLEKPLG
jgi:hypothetical protein